MKSTNFKYRCIECQRDYERDEVKYLCPECGKKYKPGKPLRGVLEVIFDYENIAAQFNSAAPDWSLFSAVDKEWLPDFPVGNTPFFQSGRLSEQTGIGNLWIKNDGLNPSGSLKDRASYLMVAEANRLGEHTIVAASTGNAASALAAVCAAEGKEAIVFVPQSAPKAKLVQMALYGARIIPVNGSYDDAFRLSLEYSDRFGGLNRNTAYHPLTIEGKKTVGLEIYRQNGFVVPDVIVVPVGDGVIISGVHKAFVDLKRAGLTDTLPRLIGVQAESSSAIHDFVQTGKYKNSPNPITIADSISVSAPSNAVMARNAVRDSEGDTVTVGDEAILEAQSRLASLTGIFAEPAASAVLVGLEAAMDLDLIGETEQIVLLITGHGLKDIDTPLKQLRLPKPIDSLDQLDQKG
ncbi:threonine synthase [bacterium]|nr:threonine synthase [bacterium]